VRDKIVQHALLEGYTSRLIKGEFPVAVISIALPYNEVDVNVHPAKHEVRFSEPNKIHETVRAAVKETLDLLDPYKKSVEDFIQKGQHYKSIGVSETPVVYQPGVKDIPAQNETVSNLGAKNVDPYIESGKQKQVSHIQENLWEKKLFKDLIVLGQLHGTYIICEAVEGIFLIDQHAAHERILYEQIKAKADSFGYSIQILLVPEVIEFGYRETGIFEKLLPDFQRAGFEVEPFGGNAFAVKSVPAFIADKDIKAIIIETVEKLIETGFIPGLERASDELLKLIACHGAIRANQKLSGKEMTTLLSQLDDCKMPSHCPHGRPTWVKFSIKELDKFFKRAV
ncbi:MAG: hypothetical protein KKA35_13380, partial [Proteobacteria bacterium]|nr:hypothetical protein [Pseudomonadota bacterium]